VKPDPVIVTRVPPAVRPVFGETDVTTGVVVADAAGATANPVTNTAVTAQASPERLPLNTVSCPPRLTRDQQTNSKRIQEAAATRKGPSSRRNGFRSRMPPNG